MNTYTTSPPLSWWEIQAIRLGRRWMTLPQADRARCYQIFAMDEPGFILRHHLRDVLGVLLWYDWQFNDLREWALKFDFATRFPNN